MIRNPAKALLITGLAFMKKIALLFVVLFLTNTTASAQRGKFVWEDEICVTEGTFNPSLYTKKQLENTYKLWYSQDFSMFVYQGMSSNSQGLMERRTVESLDTEYAQKSAALKNLEIVNVPYWKAFKEKKLKALEQDYKLARATVQAYKNPAALKEIHFAESCVKRFSKPLIAGGDDLLRVWREVDEDLRKKNSNPGELQKYFEENMASPDKFKYAQDEVIRFGLWDCVNALIDHDDDARTIQVQFLRLFKRVKNLGCDYA